jgi:hypothetical protein
MNEELVMDKATKLYDGKEFVHWRFRNYRVTTYPDSDLIYIVLANKTHKRVVGRKLEEAARRAIALTAAT